MKSIFSVLGLRTRRKGAVLARGEHSRANFCARGEHARDALIKSVRIMYMVATYMYLQDPEIAEIIRGLYSDKSAAVRGVECM